jgi:hypothetical protein
MKTFREFIFEATARRARRNPGESLEDYIKRVKGIENHPDLSPDEATRKSGKTTNVKSKDAGFGSNKKPAGTSTQTPPRGTQTRTETPPKGAEAGTQAPPRGTQASSGSTPPPSGTRTPSSTPKATSGGLSAVAKPPTVAPKGPGLRSRLGKLGGTALNVGAGALEYKDRRSAGQTRTQAATGATASAAGGEAGWRTGLRLGSSLGSKFGPKGAVIGSGIGALSGAALGSTAAGGLADKLTGASKKPTEKDYEKARQKYGVTQSRKVSAQSGTYGAKQGSALTGIGGKTAVSKDKKGAAFMSTGAGSQRKTVQLAKTQLVRDPKTGKQVVGDLAFKGGKATYLARPSVASRDTGLGGAIRNVSRATGIGGQRERDAAAAKTEYRTALKNTQTYQKKLGITPKSAAAQKLPGRGVGPAKVGPKLVGPKIVGPKKVGPAKPRNTPGSSVRPV